MNLKTVCYLTKDTLSPHKSRKHEIYHTAGKTEISDFLDILITLGPNGVRVMKWQPPARRTQSISQRGDLSDKANTEETSDGY